MTNRERAEQLVQEVGCGTFDREEVIARVERLLQPISGRADKTDNAAYWMVNYAVSRIGASRQDDRIQDMETEIRKLRLKVAKQKVQIAKFEELEAERSLNYQLDPYGSY